MDWYLVLPSMRGTGWGLQPVEMVEDDLEVEDDSEIDGEIDIPHSKLPW